MLTVRLRVVFSMASSSVMAFASPFNMRGHTPGMACCRVLSGMFVVTVETLMLRSPSVLYTWPGPGLVMSRVVQLTWINNIGSAHSSCRFVHQGLGRSSHLAELLGKDSIVRPAFLGCSARTWSSIPPRWVAQRRLARPSHRVCGLLRVPGSLVPDSSP